MLRNSALYPMSKIYYFDLLSFKFIFIVESLKRVTWEGSSSAAVRGKSILCREVPAEAQTSKGIKRLVTRRNTFEEWWWRGRGGNHPLKVEQRRKGEWLRVELGGNLLISLPSRRPAKWGGGSKEGGSFTRELRPLLEFPSWETIKSDMSGEDLTNWKGGWERQKR